MGMQRWDPFSEMMSLRDAMNRLIEVSLGISRSRIRASAPSARGR